MSEVRAGSGKWLVLLLRSSVAGLCLILFLVVLQAASFGGAGPWLELIWHLVTGFVGFLRENLPRVSTDAGTWGPGLAAFALALAVGHGFLRSWATKRSRPWSPLSTLCVGLVLPLLFAISFLVPGVLLQVGRLAEVKWFGRGTREDATIKIQLLDLGMALVVYEEEKGRLPDSLAALAELEWPATSSYGWTRVEGDSPPEPPIYLGVGLSVESDGALPLLISPGYSKNGAKFRQVLTLGSDFVEIRDEEVDEWIDRAMAAAKR